MWYNSRMEIDNFDIFKSHLTFRDKTDRYIVHIMRRPKDLKNLPEMAAIGANEHQRMLRTYYIDSLEYLDRKTPAIRELCVTNHARAYILPQVRNNFECLLSLGEKVLETIRLGNWSVKPEHLLRSAYCEYHKSRDKQWILDLDEDCMVEYRHTVNYGGQTLTTRKWTVEEVLELVRENLKTCGKDPSLAYVVKTKSGHHIVTSPFNRQKAAEECNLIYEGEKSFVTKCERYELHRGDPGYTGSIGLDTKYRIERTKLVGWLHEDGMSLLYYNDGGK